MSSKSVFADKGFKTTIDELLAQVRAIYLSDSFPWVVGYSGGKDSTVALQLVWMALQGIPADKLRKKVYVVTNNTLVENPIVSLWVSQSLSRIASAANEQKLPIYPHKLEPEIENTFWVKMIGWGYPAPRPKFRWCTHRLKISPTSRFIQRVVQSAGEAIVVLGTRKAESSARAKVFKEHTPEKGVDHYRKYLSQHSDLANAWIYSVIADWSTDDVWTFLTQQENPWKHSNEDLLTLYQGATEDSESPLVIDSNTPSSGSSRFGCWTCTLVNKDRSMMAMIHNDKQKEWMMPLLEIRNIIDFRMMGENGDRSIRDFRRMSGKVQLFNGRPIPGPYIQSFREKLLRKLLEAQKWIRKNGPEEVRDIDLISLQELCKIREIWIEEKHEVEDSLPHIYEEVMGEIFPDTKRYNLTGLGYDEMKLLKECCDEDEIHYQMVRELLHIEKEYSIMTRRAGLFGALEKAIEKGYFKDAEDAKLKASDELASKESVEDQINSITI